MGWIGYSSRKSPRQHLRFRLPSAPSAFNFCTHLLSEVIWESNSVASQVGSAYSEGRSRDGADETAVMERIVVQQGSLPEELTRLSDGFRPRDAV